MALNLSRTRSLAHRIGTCALPILVAASSYGCYQLPKMQDPLTGIPVRFDPGAAQGDALASLIGRPAGLLLTNNTRALFKDMKMRQELAKDGWFWKVRPNPELQAWLNNSSDPTFVVSPVASAIKDALGTVKVLTNYLDARTQGVALVALFDLHASHTLITSVLSMEPSRYRIEYKSSLYYIDVEANTAVLQLTSESSGECGWEAFDASDKVAEAAAFIKMQQCTLSVREHSIKGLADKIMELEPAG